MTYIIKPNKECDYCEIKETNVKFSKCSMCKCTYYCSKECQKKDWSMHKKICGNRKDNDTIRECIELIFGHGVYYFTTLLINTYNILDLRKLFDTYPNSYQKTKNVLDKASKLEGIKFRNKPKEYVLEVFAEQAIVHDSYVKIMKEDVGLVHTPSTYEKWKEGINNFNIIDKITRMDKTYIKRGKVILSIENGILINERNKEINDIIDRINKEYRDKFVNIIKYIEENKKQESIVIDKAILCIPDSYIEYHCIIDEVCEYMDISAEVII